MQAYVITKAPLCTRNLKPPPKPYHHELRAQVETIKTYKKIQAPLKSNSEVNSTSYYKKLTILQHPIIHCM